MSTAEEPGGHRVRVYPASAMMQKAAAAPTVHHTLARVNRAFQLCAALVLLLAILVLPPAARIALADGPPDLSVTHSHDGVFYVGSASAAFVFNVSNNASAGPTTGPVTVTATLPIGITFKANYLTSWVCSAAGQQVTCTRTSAFPAGYSEEARIFVDIAAAAAGPQSSSVMVATPGETNTGNNAASHPVTVAPNPPPPNLRIYGGGGGGFVVGSTTANFGLTIPNDFGGPTTGPITVTDTLPTGMTYGGIDPSADNDWSCSGSTTVTCSTPGPMPTGAVKFLNFKVNIASAALGQGSHTATVSTPGDSDLSNNTSDPISVTVVTTLGPPDLSVFKGSEGQFFVDSTSAVYLLSAFNSGDPTTAPITLTDVLPTGITFAGIDGAANGWSCSGVTTVTCTNPGPIGAAGNSFVKIKVDLAAEAIGSRSNTATASMPGEANTSNNTSGSSTVTIAATSQSLTVTSAGSGTGTVAIVNVPKPVPCGANCTQVYAPGARLTLAATPAPGSVFAGWAGACIGTSGTCQITMDAAKSLAASFRRLDVGVGVQRGPVSGSGAKTITATLSARPGCGSIDHIQFGKPGFALSNASVSIASPAGGPSNQVNAFNYVPSTSTTTVTLSIQRVVQSGAATVSPILFFDGCGEWKTFVGGGPDAFK